MITTYRRLFEAEAVGALFNLEAHDLLLKYHLAIITFRHHGWRHVSLSSVLQANGGFLKNHQFTPKTGNQIIPKCKLSSIITVRARANSTNHRLRHFPWTLTCGWAGEWAPRSSTQSSTRSHVHEKMMSHCAKTEGSQCTRSFKENHGPDFSRSQV